MASGRTLRDPGYAPQAAGLTLVGEFELLVRGHQLRIPRSAERVLTYLALAGRPVARTRLTGVLWEEGSGQGAAKSLRSTLWRIRRAGADLVLARDDRLWLCPDVTVDVADLTVLAKRLIHQPDTEALTLRRPPGVTAPSPHRLRAAGAVRDPLQPTGPAATPRGPGRHQPYSPPAPEAGRVPGPPRSTRSAAHPESRREPRRARQPPHGGRQRARAPWHSECIPPVSRR